MSIACIVASRIAAAQAVHDRRSSSTGNGRGRRRRRAVRHAERRWDSLFDANGDTVAPLPAGYSDANLVKDFQNSGTTFVTNDQTTFATGSKDTLPISGLAVRLDKT